MAVGLENWSRWERTRQGGRTRFILLWGVCAFGLSCGILGTAGFIADGTDHHRTFAWINFLPLMLSPMAGYMFGAVFWQHTESQYLNARRAVEERAQQRQMLESLSHEVRQLREELREERTR
jgi:hypothetical protein